MVLLLVPSGYVCVGPFVVSWSLGMVPNSIVECVTSCVPLFNESRCQLSLGDANHEALWEYSVPFPRQVARIARRDFVIPMLIMFSNNHRLNLIPT